MAKNPYPAGKAYGGQLAAMDRAQLAAEDAALDRVAALPRNQRFLTAAQVRARKEAVRKEVAFRAFCRP